ncbi:Lrp/AsnC family transcriptional regulator [Thalassospira sp.]|uniref:Lrp/AsnC family transcriptional regulator n=1 Tax=Thalassospira sp. TaxID=1912094 RepID=UPI000C6267BC|nr:Lrp/AsnC family transcriptional regulator [Thalassospira sp.]MBC04910.1 ArsR family transcriptional regulator [Thalassospira sp.]|tara:strand:+ start:1415 stop:1843 length:429 start_codon:yes stop_codon:yes gene_type:complete
MDNFDLRLLELLQVNSRQTGNELADKVGLSPAACLRRVQRLRETGVIERDIAVVSPKVFGKRMTVMVLLTVERDRPDRYVLMREEFAGMPEVLQCHHVTGAHDFILRVQVADMEEYSALVERVFHAPHIRRYESLAVLGSLK